jgi:hypothetical protein
MNLRYGTVSRFGKPLVINKQGLATYLNWDRREWPTHVTPTEAAPSFRIASSDVCFAPRRSFRRPFLSDFSRDVRSSHASRLG